MRESATGSPGPVGSRASLVELTPQLGGSLGPGDAGLRGGVSARGGANAKGRGPWRKPGVRATLQGRDRRRSKATCRPQLRASPVPRSGKVRAPRALQPAPIHVLREHSMPQGAGKTPHSRPEGREIDYIRCILPRGRSGNTLRAVSGTAVWGAEGQTERGRKGSREK